MRALISKYHAELSTWRKKIVNTTFSEAYSADLKTSNQEKISHLFSQIENHKNHYKGSYRQSQLGHYARFSGLQCVIYYLTRNILNKIANVDTYKSFQRNMRNYSVYLSGFSLAYVAGALLQGFDGCPAQMLLTQEAPDKAAMIGGLCGALCFTSCNLANWLKIFEKQQHCTYFGLVLGLVLPYAAMCNIEKFFYCNVLAQGTEKKCC